MVRNRAEEIHAIHAKGFDMTNGRPSYYSEDGNFHQNYIGNNLPSNVVNYGTVKIGTKKLEDAVLDLGTYKKINPIINKVDVLRAIDNYDLKTMREISDFFYKTSGIYSRIIRYMAFMYRYDWYITPYINDDKVDDKKVKKTFFETLQRLDNFHVKKVLGEIALKVLRYGAYYGYKVKTSKGYILQELPPNFCRSRFTVGDLPVVEFDMKFFDTFYRDTEQRMKVLKMFPEEFQKGYVLYKKGKLQPVFPGDGNGWYPLDPTMSVKFNATGEDYPMFISVIPLIIDLDEAQGIDRKKSLQRLMKILIQKMPLDKNGDLIFDIDEAQQMHNNAVQMLSRAIGVDVLTTFAEVDVEDIAANNAASAQTDDLERVERQVYNEAGVSQMQFNTNGNLALEKSIANDEATLYNMILQFEIFLNTLLSDFNKHVNKLEFRVQILPTTIYNFKELSKLYKEQTQLGYSKILPQLALGQSQSSILANAYFENDVLDLVHTFIPPLMSSTMNSDVLEKTGGKGQPKVGDQQGAGRKEKPDDEKSEKTIKNIESKG